jgi:hypothetical protein
LSFQLQFSPPLFNNSPYGTCITTNNKSTTPHHHQQQQQQQSNSIKNKNHQLIKKYHQLIKVAYADVFLGLPARLLGSALFAVAYRELVDEEQALQEAVATGRALAPSTSTTTTTTNNGGGGGSGGALALSLERAAEALNPFTPKRPPPPPPPTLFEELGNVARFPKKKKKKGSASREEGETFELVPISAEEAAQRGPLLVLLGLGASLRLAGSATKVGRELLELFDTFVGRYLVYATFGYVTLKFVHFKIFPDFPF